MLYKEYLWKDREFGEGDRLPGHKSILIPGKRGRLLSLFYYAGGEEVHPTVLICHGFPGNEQNLDIAQGLRRIGFNTMSFHYSGSWGSDGDYSFSHCLEDTETVLDYMLEHAEELGIDKEQLFLYGHSLGGFVSANLFAAREEFRACILMSPADLGESFRYSLSHPEVRSFMIRFLDDGSQWLNGTSGEMLASDLEQIVPQCCFLSLAEKISERPLLMITGKQDTTTPYEMDQKPLMERLDELGRKNHTHVSMDTGHGYEDKRIRLTELIVGYLVNLTENTDQKTDDSEPFSV